ncbi:MAG: helix-turn-helix domain-containing protein [Desulfobacteraceae bacterium]|nr:MAG: helix-turn-helix domain-containing protein [Desulfobacteraceae bacterium]
MKKAVVLGCINTMATTVFGPMDILNQAGRLWARVHGEPKTPFFDVCLASPDGGPIRCTNNVMVQPHKSIREIEQADLIVISSATYIDRIIEAYPDLVDCLRRHYDQGTHMASVCTGVNLLAETGLLDGKSATLHWGFTRSFKKRYPHIALEPEKMVIDHGRLYCSAGVTAGMDLSLYLVDKFCGRQVGLELAKSMVLDLGRRLQTPYSAFMAPRDHRDPVVIAVQERIEARYVESIDYNDLAAQAGVSRRSLERRFKRATGMTPLSYLQQFRVETARQLLETGGHTFSEVTYMVGYEDVSFFRKLFVKLTGLRPKAYQQRYLST